MSAEKLIRVVKGWFPVATHPKEDSKMKPRISMITLGVRDLAASVKFYEEGLGFPRMESPPTVVFFYLERYLAGIVRTGSVGSGRHGVGGRFWIRRFLPGAQCLVGSGG